MADLTKTIKDSFLQFSGAVLQSRALVDVRDCVKPSARQIFYCMETDKFTHDKPFQKTLKAIGSSFRLYIHGDSSAEGVIMRAGQPFAMRYPLVEVEGSYGTLLASSSWAAPRYTGARLSPLADYLFSDLDKEVISEWRDNYDNTEKYPTVLPSKGFYNLVNGSYGIGVGASASIPQYNLQELNTALITLLNNPNATFDEIYCAPDFATGALLLNAAEVKESHRNGTGFACKLRSVVDYNKNEKCLVVTEIPYMVYTETICKELEAIISDENNPGIERFNDLTGKTPLIKIYLSKTANVDKIIKYLYKNTSLQSHYGVNFTMLKDGRFPQVFGWREILQAHLDHEKIVYRRGFEYDIRKLKARQHILEGYLICLARIEEVVQTIKKSATTAAAKSNLMQEYLLDDAQATAVLKLTLSRLAHLEVEKIEKEKQDIIQEVVRLEAILADEKLLNKEIGNGLREVMTKFGDERRTTIMDVENENEETVEVKQLQLSLSNKNNIFVNESSSLYTQKRGGIGAKIKMDAGEYVIDSLTIKSSDTILFFSKSGNCYAVAASLIDLDKKIAIESLIGCGGEEIIAMTSLNKNNTKPFILFITKQGYLKKSNISEYNVKKTMGIKALSLEPNDEIVNVLFTDKEIVALLTSQGNFVMVDSAPIRPIGRIARGIRGIKLNEGDYVVSGRCVKQTAKSIVSITRKGLIKQTTIDEFTVQGTNTKGAKIQKLTEHDTLADFLPINDHPAIFIASSCACIKVPTKDIPMLSRGTQGVVGIKLSGSNQVVSLS